jgi:hypothetical protein
MKDFKKMPKMADGGSVADKFKESVISRLKERFPDKEPEKVDRKPFENSAQRTLRQLRGTPGGGSMGGGDMSGMKGLDKPYKRGGKVKK